MYAHIYANICIYAIYICHTYTLASRLDLLNVNHDTTGLDLAREISQLHII